MKYYSTKNINHKVDLRTAVLHSLPPDNGLYMPDKIEVLSDRFYKNLYKMSLQDIAYEVSLPYLNEDFSEREVCDIVEQAINFPAPLIHLNEYISVLELWHGPSLAFKDFGARFMANVMGRLVSGEDKKLTILVATSGDTGGAVASGFLGVDGVEVLILYPKGKVSPLQEKQLTTLGQNISAIEIDGTFDDCQALVKAAFLDQHINDRYLLSSANSINIARLIPQSFYYFDAVRQLEGKEHVINFCIPSGNFGNLTAGLLAKQMGLAINKFIAATNVNNVVPIYLDSGYYNPKASVQTSSNAMDVGNPSNFKRMEHLYGTSWQKMTEDIIGFHYIDLQTSRAIKEVYDHYDYIMDPHGAIGYLAAKEYNLLYPGEKTVVLETAHPAKFLPVMNPILGDINIPEALASLSDKHKSASPLTNDFDSFKAWMLAKS